jgi:transcriptional regulator with XRE-family HTH domain
MLPPSGAGADALPPPGQRIRSTREARGWTQVVLGRPLDRVADTWRRRGGRAARMEAPAGRIARALAGIAKAVRDGR